MLTSEDPKEKALQSDRTGHTTSIDVDGMTPHTPLSLSLIHTTSSHARQSQDSKHRILARSDLHSPTTSRLLLRSVGRLLVSAPSVFSAHNVSSTSVISKPSASNRILPRQFSAFAAAAQTRDRKEGDACRRSFRASHPSFSSPRLLLVDDIVVPLQIGQAKSSRGQEHEQEVNGIYYTDRGRHTRREREA